MRLPNINSLMKPILIITFYFVGFVDLRLPYHNRFILGHVKISIETVEKSSSKLVRESWQ